MDDWDEQDDQEEVNSHGGNFPLEYSVEEWSSIFSNKWKMVETPTGLVLYDDDYNPIPFEDSIFEYLVGLHNLAVDNQEEYQKYKDEHDV